MTYMSALEAAGATVKDFKSFGDWHGRWVALVDYEGVTAWVSGAYGSCSHCDSFEAEFAYSYEGEKDYATRLKKFGKSYLDDLRTTVSLIKEFEEDADVDEESRYAMKWIAATAAKYMEKSDEQSN